MQIIKTYKKNRRVIFYIYQDSAGKYHACTGKPSDSACISWIYNALEEAEETAREYLETDRETRESIACIN